MHLYFFFFKQKTAYELRISDWSSDVCSSDLRAALCWVETTSAVARTGRPFSNASVTWLLASGSRKSAALLWRSAAICSRILRSEEHTSELQSLMRISYAVFCLKKKKKKIRKTTTRQTKCSQASKNRE